jgi:hypothetical protein
MSIMLGKILKGQKKKTFTTNQETSFLRAAVRDRSRHEKGPGQTPGAFEETAGTA